MSPAETQAVDKGARARWESVGVGVACVVAVIAVSASAVLLRFGSFPHAMRYARGARVFAEISTLVLPASTPGSVVHTNVMVHNLSNETARIIGADITCSCVSIDELPIVILAGESRKVALTLRFDDHTTGSFAFAVSLHTDHPSSPRIPLVIKVGIDPAEPSARKDTD